MIIFRLPKNRNVYYDYQKLKKNFFLNVCIYQNKNESSDFNM